MQVARTEAASAGLPTKPLMARTGTRAGGGCWSPDNHFVPIDVPEKELETPAEHHRPPHPPLHSVAGVRCQCDHVRSSTITACTRESVMIPDQGSGKS